MKFKKISGSKVFRSKSKISIHNVRKILKKQVHKKTTAIKKRLSERFQKREQVLRENIEQEMHEQFDISLEKFHKWPFLPMELKLEVIQRMRPRDRLRFAGTSNTYRKLVDKNFKIFTRETVNALKLEANSSGEAKFELWMRDETTHDISNTPNRKFHVPRNSLRLVLAGFQVQKCLKLNIYDTVRAYNEVIDIISETCGSITQLELELSHAYSYIRSRKNTKKLTTKHLEECVSKLPNLTSLNLSGWTREITGNGLPILRQMKSCHRIDIETSLRISFNDKALETIAKKSSVKDPIKEIIMYGPSHKFSLQALLEFLQNGNFEDRANLHLSVVNSTLAQVREALFNRTLDNMIIERGGDDDDFYIHKAKNKYYLWIEVNEQDPSDSDSD